MFVEKYKKANDSICVSNERKEELISIMRKSNLKRERAKRLKKIELLAACFLIIFVACAVAAMSKDYTVKIDKTTGKSETVGEEMFFNKIGNSVNESEDELQFDIAGGGDYKRSELPDFLMSALPDFSNENDNSEELFEASYSDNWDEFYVNSTQKYVSVLAKRNAKNGETIPKDWVKSNLSNTKYDVYFAETKEGGKCLMSANYVTDNGILIEISTDELGKSEFVKLIESSLKTG